MFKIIGVVTFIAVAAIGAAQFTGHLELDGNIDVTKKGQALVNDGLNSVQKLTNKGLDGAQELTNKGFKALRDEKARVKNGL